MRWKPDQVPLRDDLAAGDCVSDNRSKDFRVQTREEPLAHLLARYAASYRHRGRIAANDEMIARKGERRSLKVQLSKCGSARRKLGLADQDNARENFRGAQMKANPRATTQGSRSRCEKVQPNVDHWRGHKSCGGRKHP